MCGIAGLWYFDGQSVCEEDIHAMNALLAHRGPDGEGILLNGSLGLGHRRLAILDLSSAGRQPMSYAHGRYWITYNGEIYNFLELRERLAKLGYQFCSETDTEVILAAYDAWGPECLPEFNGMWAFAIWDRQEQRLFLSRDRFGIKPLFYLADQNHFAFASEMKAFLALPGFRPMIDRSVLKAQLLNVFSQESGENCLLRGLKRLPLGHAMMVTRNDLIVYQWWKTADNLVEVPARLEDQAMRFWELFADSCRLRMRSDVPISTLLSGGLDSSAVTCTLTHIQQNHPAKRERLAEDWQKVFIGTFPGTTIDERPYADEVVRFTGVEPIYIELEESQFLDPDRLLRIVFHFDDIYNSMPGAAFNLYEAVRSQERRVTLDGHGGDELLGGYPHYINSTLSGLGDFYKHPLQFIDLLRTYYRMRRGGMGNIQEELISLVWQTSPMLRRMRSVGYRVKARLTTQNPGPNSEIDQSHPWLTSAMQKVPIAPNSIPDIPQQLDSLNRTLYRDFHAGILPAILRNFDRASMAHGVEVRMPFMDWRLVTFCFSIPWSSKIGQGHTKLILRHALGERLPASIRNRDRKIGLNLPMPEWFQANLKPWLMDITGETDFLTSDIWAGPAIRAFLEERNLKGWTWSDAHRLWPFIHAFLWQRIFVDRPTAEIIQTFTHRSNVVCHTEIVQ